MDMEKPKRDANLSPEEQRLKESLMRKKSSTAEVKHGSGRVPEDFWDMSRPKILNGSLLEALLRDREEGR